MGAEGTVNARGVPISEALLEQILAAAPHDADNHPTLTAAHFERATFQGGAWFTGATFQGGAWFNGVRFQGDAEFLGARFGNISVFAGVRFQGDAEFKGTAFRGAAFFDRATFEGVAWFGETTKTNYKATFRGYAGFGGATFQNDAEFNGTSFQGYTEFNGVSFQGAAQFGGGTFKGAARFDSAIFERARKFGPVLADRGLSLDYVRFDQPVQIEVSTIGLCCRGARFPSGVQFRLRWARVALDDTDFAGPSILAGTPRLSSDKLATQEQRIARAWQRLLGEEISKRPRLLSLQRANVAGLGMGNVDLADCRFAGAHNLDKLRLQADISLAVAPTRLQWDWRQVIAEERAWRADRSRRWSDPWWPTKAGKTELEADKAWAGERPAVMEAGQIAGLYRALRKGREDAKDEPDAADFYYGEMEMRRHAGRPTENPTGEASRGQVERAILTVYWLISGYGLRAWRALAWLAALTAGFAVAFHLAGFTRPPQPDSYWTSLLYAFRATLSLTDNEVQLTAWGKLLQGLLRLTGPVLLGLTLLAIRARTKR